MIEKAVAFIVKDLKYDNAYDCDINMRKCLTNPETEGVLGDVSNLLLGKPVINIEYGAYRKGNNKVFERDYTQDQLELFATISINLKKNNIMTLSLYKNDYELYFRHVYSVLGARIDEAVRLLIKIRNPHNRSPDKRYYSKLSGKNFMLVQQP